LKQTNIIITPRIGQWKGRTDNIPSRDVIRGGAKGRVAKPAQTGTNRDM
jgi:hypothetical protein